MYLFIWISFSFHRMSISVRALDASTAPKDSSIGAKRATQEQEEELILTAWQDMSRVLQQHGFTEEPRSPRGAQSFLSKQRLSTLRHKSKT